MLSFITSYYFNRNILYANNLFKSKIVYEGEKPKQIIILHNHTNEAVIMVKLVATEILAYGDMSNLLNLQADVTELKQAIACLESTFAKIYGGNVCLVVPKQLVEHCTQQGYLSNTKDIHERLMYIKDKTQIVKTIDERHDDLDRLRQEYIFISDKNELVQHVNEISELLIHNTNFGGGNVYKRFLHNASITQYQLADENIMAFALRHRETQELVSYIKLCIIGEIVIMEDLVTKKEHRRKGVALLLLANGLEYAREVFEHKYIILQAGNSSLMQWYRSKFGAVSLASEEESLEKEAKVFLFKNYQIKPLLCSFLCERALKETAKGIKNQIVDQISNLRL